MTRLRLLRALVHLFGLATIATALTTQTLMLNAIREQGVFIAKEPNITVCYIELATTILGIIYFIYIFITTLKRLAQRHIHHLGHRLVSVPQ